MRFFGVSIEPEPTIVLPGLALAALRYKLAGDEHRRLLTALATGALWYEADFNHIVGHMISAHLVGAPMDRVRWGILPATLYDNNDITPQQHIGRAIGGPIGSAISMLIWWVVWRSLQGKPGGSLALTALLLNTALALASWLPLPFVDGGVILKNMWVLEH